MKPRKFSLAVKVIVFQLIFLVLHFAYEIAPHPVIAIFSGIDESVYQHVKVAFFTSIVTALVEYFWLRSTLSSPLRFVTSRIFTSVFLPWVMIVYFLLGPLLFGRITSIPLEIIFANVILIFTSSTAFIIERYVEGAEPRKDALALLGFLFLLTLVQYVTFTQQLPWYDIFARPPGW